MEPGALSGRSSIDDLLDCIEASMGSSTAKAKVDAARARLKEEMIYLVQDLRLVTEEDWEEMKSAVPIGLRNRILKLMEGLTVVTEEYDVAVTVTSISTPPQERRTAAPEKGQSRLNAASPASAAASAGRTPQGCPGAVATAGRGRGALPAARLRGSPRGGARGGPPRGRGSPRGRGRGAAGPPANVPARGSPQGGRGERGRGRGRAAAARGQHGPARGAARGVRGGARGRGQALARGAPRGARGSPTCAGRGRGGVPPAGGRGRAVASAKASLEKQDSETYMVVVGDVREGVEDLEEYDSDASDLSSFEEINEEEEALREEVIAEGAEDAAAGVTSTSTATSPVSIDLVKEAAAPGFTAASTPAAAGSQKVAAKDKQDTPPEGLKALLSCTDLTEMIAGPPDVRGPEAMLQYPSPEGVRGILRNSPNYRSVKAWEEEHELEDEFFCEDDDDEGFFDDDESEEQSGPKRVQWWPGL